MSGVDVSELHDSVLEWANRAAGQALDGLRDYVRTGHFPFGVYDAEDQSAPGVGEHIGDSEEAAVDSEGELWQGHLAYLAEHASYQNEGSGPIQGNPWLYFYWGGHLIRVESTSGYDVWTGWFTDYTTEADWERELDAALTAEPML